MLVSWQQVARVTFTELINSIIVLVSVMVHLRVTNQLKENMILKRGEEVFENSPKKPKADVRHEIIPEIDVASRILQQPETADKLREVSKKIKLEDEKWKGKTFMKSPMSTPSASPSIRGGDENTYSDNIDSRPIVPFSHNLFKSFEHIDQETGNKRKMERALDYGTGSPLQQRIKRCEHDDRPLLENEHVIDSRRLMSEETPPMTWLNWIRELLCC